MQARSLSPAEAGSGVNDQQQTPLPAAPPRAPDASVPDLFATRWGRGVLAPEHRPRQPVPASPRIFGWHIQQGCPQPAVATAPQPPSGAGHVAGVWGTAGDPSPKPFASCSAPQQPYPATLRRRGREMPVPAPQDEPQRQRFQISCIRFALMFPKASPGFARALISRKDRADNRQTANK